MEAKNFRIGNFVNDYEVNEGFFKIEEIKKNSQGNNAVYYRNGSCMSIDADPVYLTGYIFVCLDFKQDEIGYWTKGDSIYSFVDRKERGYMLVVADTEHKETYIKHLHELQNLFFALEGTELDVSSMISYCS
ncbi:MAG: hypothetical protein GY793_06410 [Proteobacteria bacterium]|nr:hypothetical protein [Pseudomonadota bacterium]